MSKNRTVLSIIIHAIYGALCIQLTHFCLECVSKIWSVLSTTFHATQYMGPCDDILLWVNFSLSNSITIIFSQHFTYKHLMVGMVRGCTMHSDRHQSMFVWPYLETTYCKCIHINNHVLLQSFTNLHLKSLISVLHSNQLFSYSSVDDIFADLHTPSSLRMRRELCI